MLRTFPSPFSGEQAVTVTFETPVESVCPFDGQRDTSTLIVAYTPNAACLELASFGVYVAELADQAISHEDIARMVWADLFAVLAPQSLSVRDTFVRGETTLSVEVAR